ncbi:MAG: glycosyltransferase family 4 protein [Planctomycetaceae bacterium]|nr:glycosyltransferase family 4 protein [Planctomycetaceae bacterium]
MKILYFHQHFSTPDGSTGIRSYEMSKRLVAAGHEVTMVCGSYQGGKTGLDGPFRSGRRSGIVDGIHVIELELAYSNRDGFLKRTLTFLKFALRSVGIALFTKYDLLFATTTPLTAGIPGIAAWWFRRKPFIFEVRDLWPELPKAMGVIRNPIVLWAMSFLEWLSYFSATRLVGLSPGIVEGIEKRGIPKHRIAMIPNGCDIELFQQTPTPWRPTDIAADDFMAVFSGTHGIANGLDAVLDAAKVLKARGNTRIKILLIGDGKLKAKLQARAQAEGLDNVVFHPPVGKTKLVGLFAATDLGLQILQNVPAFYFGTSPNKFFDYLSAGLPALTNYPGWVAEMIEANQCGFAVRPDDPEAFADRLEEASRSTELKAMGQRALALAKSKFSRDYLGERFVSWLTTGRLPN